MNVPTSGLIRRSALRVVLFGIVVLAARPSLGQILPSAPALLNTNAVSDTGNDADPAVLTDGMGNWVALWTSQFGDLNGAGFDRDVFVTRSTNNGVTWTDPALVNSNGTVDSGGDYNPVLATDGAGEWIAVWWSDDIDLGNGNDADLVVSRSDDNGATWTPVQLLNTDGLADSGGDRLPSIATDGAGQWVVVWYSDEDRNGAGTDQDIFVSRSTNNGMTWTAPALLNTNGATDTGGDILPVVATDGAGGWVTVWESSTNLLGAGGDLDLFVSKSTDNGVTWSAPALLNTNATTDVEDDENPAISTDNAGVWVVVWESKENVSGSGADRDILVSHSFNVGATWTAPALLNTSAATDIAFDSRPTVDSDGAGAWVALWDSREALSNSGSDDDVFASLSVDDGATWSTPTLFNTNGTIDSGEDTFTAVTNDRAGHWIGMWVSNENISETGTDNDIAFARFSLALGGMSDDPADINGDMMVNAVDVQLVINAALGLNIGAFNADVNGDSTVNAVDIQLVINAALGLTG